MSTRAPRGPDLGEPTTLVLVRHGRTALTEQGRFSGGGGPDPALSAAGRRDAAGVAEVLSREQDRIRVLGAGAPPSAVLTSPLLRARQTAAAVAATLGLQPVVVEPGMTEAGFGDWEGLSYAEVSAGWPDQLRQWQGSTEVAPPGGESLDQVVTRVLAATARVVAGHRGRTVVVVTHVTPVRVVVRHALTAGAASLWRIRVAPCSVTAVRFWDDGGTEVMTVNAPTGA